MNAVLVMVKADGSRRAFPLAAGATTVGRKNSCGLRIPLTSVSRLHCEFRLEDDRLSVRDLGSSNGTFRNGERVQDSDLSAGDEVEVGPVRFTVVLDGEPAAALEAGPAGGAAALDDTAGSPKPELEDANDGGDELDDLLSDENAGDEALPTTGILSGGASVDLAGDDAADVEADDLDEDDELAAAMAQMDDDDVDGAGNDGEIDLGIGDPDDSSEFAFELDDDGDDADDPPIELLNEDDKT